MSYCHEMYIFTLYITYYAVNLYKKKKISKKQRLNHSLGWAKNLATYVVVIIIDKQSERN